MTDGLYSLTTDGKVQKLFQRIKFDPKTEKIERLRSLVKRLSRRNDDNFRIYDMGADICMDSDLSIEMAKPDVAFKFLLILNGTETDPPIPLRFVEGHQPEELKPAQQTSVGLTIGQFLDRYVIYPAEVRKSDPKSDPRSEKPLPFWFECNNRDSKPSTKTSICEFHPNTKVVAWVTLKEDLNQVIEANAAKLSEIVKHPVQPGDIVCKFSNEQGMNYFDHHVLADSIGQFFPDLRIDRETVSQGTKCEPDFTFVSEIRKRAELIMENKALGCLNYRDITKCYADQKPDYMAKPLNQLIGYMLVNGCRYGVLSDMDHSYAFKHTGTDKDGCDIFQVSTTPIPTKDRIRLLFCLLLDSAQNKEPGPKKLTVKEAAANKDAQGSGRASGRASGSKPKSNGKNSTSGSGAHSGSTANNGKNVKKKPYQGHYAVESDILKDQANFELSMSEYFKQSSFDLLKDLPRDEHLGKGRCGCVSLGFVRNHDGTPPFKCAIKMADLSKKPYLREEMDNEVRVLVYLQSLGLKCVPAIRWAGRKMGMFYILATDFIDGYKVDDLKSLGENEKYMFEEALIELREANVIHGDLKEDNVIFTRDQCYIIDYGMAQILLEDGCWDSTEYDYDDSGFDDEYDDTHDDTHDDKLVVVPQMSDNIFSFEFYNYAELINVVAPEYNI